MDIKSIRIKVLKDLGNKYRKINIWIKRIPIDIRVTLSAAVLWIIVQWISHLPFNNYRFSFKLYSFVAATLSSVIGLIIIRKGYIIFTNPSELREQWRQSFLLFYFRSLEGGLKDTRVSLRMVAFASLSAIAGIMGWELSHVHSHRVEIWFILYMCLYVFIVIPAVMSKLGLFHKISNGAKEIAEGNLQSTIQVNGTDALSNLASHINNMKLGYQKALESQMKSERLKSELITNVSHDLKTPLTSIINYVGLLKKEGLSFEEVNAYVEVLDRKSFRLKVLIEDLFEASKMSSGSVELDIQNIDVAALLNQAMAEFSDKIEESFLTIRVKIEKPHIYAHLDGNKTWRVFENLIGNAQKYSLPHTRIFISLDETEDHVLFKIQNTSAYEIDFDVEDLFERFKRADVSRHTEGSGLGLAIAKSIVELQGGEIKIEVDGDQFKVLISIPK